MLPICTGPGGEPSPLHFTGQQHDNETGLDHFPARYYTSTWGVWMTPDWSRSPTGVPYATFSDPQSLDLYNYTLGNPETNTDPNGHWCFIGVGPSCPAGHTDRTHAHGTKPPLSGPSWFARCQANLFCGAALDASIIPLTLFSGRRRSTGWSPSKPLPDNPSKLGPGWRRDPGHRAPNDERYVNGKGEKLDWHKGVPGTEGELGKDHWHWYPGGVKDGRHYHPGDTVRKVATAVSWAAVAAVAGRVLFALGEGAAAF